MLRPIFYPGNYYFKLIKYKQLWKLIYNLDNEKNDSRSFQIIIIFIKKTLNFYTMPLISRTIQIELDSRRQVCQYAYLNLYVVSLYYLWQARHLYVFKTVICGVYYSIFILFFPSTPPPFIRGYINLPLLCSPFSNFVSKTIQVIERELIYMPGAVTHKQTRT